MTINKVSWLISVGDNPYSETIELPFLSEGKDNMRQAERELDNYMAKNYPGQAYSILYWDWIDPENKMVECKTCGTWYGSIWNKRGGCLMCQENKAREERKQKEEEWKQQARVEYRQKKIRWWKTRKIMAGG